MGYTSTFYPATSVRNARLSAIHSAFALQTVHDVTLKGACAWVLWGNSVTGTQVSCVKLPLLSRTVLTGGFHSYEIAYKKISMYEGPYGDFPCPRKYLREIPNPGTLPAPEPYYAEWYKRERANYAR